eukprot:1963776-Karenia_brevis.AAC.1
MQLLHNHYQDEQHRYLRQCAANRKASEKTKMLNDKSSRIAYKKIGGDFCASLASLKDHNGNITSRPHEMDDILQRAWQQVYKGNVTHVVPLLANYFAKYGEGLYKEPEFKLPPLTGPVLKETCMDASHSAAGMDNWAPADFKLFSDHIF